MPTSPLGSDDGESATPASTVKVYEVPASVPMLSVGVTVNETVPLEVGVPLMVMLPVPLAGMMTPETVLVMLVVRAMAPQRRRVRAYFTRRTVERSGRCAST